MTTSSSPDIADQYFGQQPFTPDIFQRKKFAYTLTQYLKKPKNGITIAINGGWGTGKTWFGRNWQKQLDNDDEFQTIWVDAFSIDYVQDPFLALISPIIELSPPNKKKAFKELAIATVKNLAPVVAAGAVCMAVDAVSGPGTGKDLAEAIKKSGTDLAEKIIIDQLKGLAEERQTVSSLKAKLAQIALQKPIIYFIDELDRCRPDFALKVIERIKHFFEVPNVHFVLLINSEQLENAICGIYGEKFNAQEYLSKFTHYTFNLPNIRFKAETDKRSVKQYINQLFKKYIIEENEAATITSFTKALSITSIAMQLSLRDIDKCVMAYILDKPNFIR